ncbi:MarR family transcriptional regulator [Cognatishimia sp. SS12]|uniref:MarR family winged helix-turn-helix transcriptional regulator n=1 Tax=Cognatishimia sp. SS12 TaxID=2979465 RepID=UPI00232A9104|nr:MarR family transcriptional regulator [Cognatishimia sp. SS12]MDC0739321.1 MarR family transcriptional regulator [Cognatishimia sp. SS12]
MTAPIVSDDDFDDFINVRALKMAVKLQLLMQRRALRPARLQLQEWRILLSLARHGDQHLRAITERAALDPAHASRTAARLLKRGLILRSQDRADKRRHVLSLTPAGIAMVEEIWPTAQGITQEFRALFSDREFQDFKSLLDRSIGLADQLLAQTEPNVQG